MTRNHGSPTYNDRLRADTPIELPVTALYEVAELLREAQKDIGAIGMSSPSDIMALVHVANDKLAQARILVDVERGDGQ